MPGTAVPAVAGTAAATAASGSGTAPVPSPTPCGTSGSTSGTEPGWSPRTDPAAASQRPAHSSVIENQPSQNTTPMLSRAVVIHFRTCGGTSAPTPANAISSIASTTVAQTS